VPRRPDKGRVDRRRNHERSLAEGWREMSWTTRILRAFLGVTFLFAGVQKLFDPNFLHAGSATFVGNQLRGFAQGTPAGPLLSFLDRAPVVAGIGIALVEIAIGLGTVLGVAPIAAALGGVAVSLSLWLSATWHVHPYFLGSDSIYTVAWIAFLTGIWQAERARFGHVPGPVEVVDRMDRRQFLRGGVVACLTIAVAAAAKAFAGPLAPTSTVGTQARDGVAGPTGPTGRGSSGSPSVAGHTITTLDALPVGKAIGFTAPGVGAAVLVRLANDRVVAYSRICTHAGCLVGYDPSNRILFCPCHGAEFDPAQGAAPIAGPAPTALQTIPVVVDPATREVILPG
jgi:thiosulfate dehydrogenase [quinone] large subunit